MKENEKIPVDIKILDKIIKKIEQVQGLSSELTLCDKGQELINYLDVLKRKQLDTGLEDEIYNKMKEVKNSDPELNSKLYILYRKLCDKKISNDEAQLLFDMYVKEQPYDKYIY